MELSQEDKKFLELYSDSDYQKPSVTVDSVIFRIVNEEEENYRRLAKKKLQVLLTKRNWAPFLHCYALPGTFISLEHELAQSMKLCVKNKVGLQNYYYEQLYTFGDTNRDPRTRVLSVSFLLLTNAEATVDAGEWFDVVLESGTLKREVKPEGFVQEQQFSIVLTNQGTTLISKLFTTQTKHKLQETKQISVASSDLAFDHAKIVFFALERIKNKIEYTDIIFNLLPPLFTLTELKLAYELILQEQLLDANFRRKTSKMVQATNQYVTGKGHRSSQLFCLNPNWKTTNLD